MADMDSCTANQMDLMYKRPAPILKFMQIADGAVLYIVFVRSLQNVCETGSSETLLHECNKRNIYVFKLAVMIFFKSHRHI